MFKISAILVEENDRIEKNNLDLKEYIVSLEENNKTLKLEVANIKNSRETCETYVLLKKEVMNFLETLSKFNKGK